jgi:hypothetical protein
MFCWALAVPSGCLVYATSCLVTQLGQRGIETPRYQRVAEDWPAVESFELRLQSLVLEELGQGVQLSGHFSGVGHFS